MYFRNVIFQLSLVENIVVKSIIISNYGKKLLAIGVSSINMACPLLKQPRATLLYKSCMEVPLLKESRLVLLKILP